MEADLPGSVLFCCDYNSVRSPMAEGLLKQHVGHAIYVQSAGIKNDLEIDGFTIAVCQELGIELGRHRVRTMDEMVEWGDDLESYDLIVALSPASQRRALDFTRFAAIDVEYWPVIDPTGLGETREAKLASYRQARDQISKKIAERFGPPKVQPNLAEGENGKDD